MKILKDLVVLFRQYVIDIYLLKELTIEEVEVNDFSFIDIYLFNKAVYIKIIHLINLEDRYIVIPLGITFNKFKG